MPARMPRQHSRLPASLSLESRTQQTFTRTGAPRRGHERRRLRHAGNVADTKPGVALEPLRKGGSTAVWLGTCYVNPVRSPDPPSSSRFIHDNIELVQELEGRTSRLSLAERVSDVITRALGTLACVITHLVVFGLWFLVNSGAVPGVEPFDPFPFGIFSERQRGRLRAPPPAPDRRAARAASAAAPSAPRASARP